MFFSKHAKNATGSPLSAITGRCASRGLNPTRSCGNDGWSLHCSNFVFSISNSINLSRTASLITWWVGDSPTSENAFQDSLSPRRQYRPKRASFLRYRPHPLGPLPLPFPFLRGGWLHHWWLHPARRPQLGSNAQPQINRYGYVNLFEAFANLKRMLKRSCVYASEDMMGAPIMSLLIAKLATQEPRKWSEVSLSSLQSGHKVWPINI